jgi:hypothetical protein
VLRLLVRQSSLVEEKSTEAKMERFLWLCAGGLLVGAGYLLGSGSRPVEAGGVAVPPSSDKPVVTSSEDGRVLYVWSPGVWQDGQPAKVTSYSAYSGTRLISEIRVKPQDGKPDTPQKD